MLQRHPCCGNGRADWSWTHIEDLIGVAVPMISYYMLPKGRDKGSKMPFYWCECAYLVKKMKMPLFYLSALVNGDCKRSAVLHPAQPKPVTGVQVESHELIRMPTTTFITNVRAESLWFQRRYRYLPNRFGKRAVEEIKQPCVFPPLRSAVS